MSLTEKSGFSFFTAQNIDESRQEYSMAKPDLNIIVCVDPQRCLALNFQGRDSRGLLQEIQDQITNNGLADRVQATPCRCIFGCTYGPRIDVINRTTGEKTLYGAVEARVEISVRGRVDMKKIPDGLIELAQANLS